MNLPGAIIYINSDINDLLKNTLVKQLLISEVVQDTEFDARVVADPNYPSIIHSQMLRIMVIRSNYRDLTNRNLADVVLFLKAGLASILCNKVGPPTLTLPIERLNIYAILRFVDSPEVPDLTEKFPEPPCCPTGPTGPCGNLSTHSIHGRQSPAEEAETIVEQELQDEMGIQTNTEEWRDFIRDVENEGGDGSFH